MCTEAYSIAFIIASAIIPLFISPVCRSCFHCQTAYSEADPGGGLRGCNPPPPFGKFSNLSGYPCLSLFHIKSNIISYDISSSPQSIITRRLQALVIPLFDSLIIHMQDRFSDEDRHASHLLCLVPSIIVNKALQLDPVR